MNAKGSVFKYPDNVDTDVIIPARHLNTQDAKELASHCMEDIDKDFVTSVGNGRLDAVANAIQSATGMEFHLETYSEHSLDEGSTSRAASYVGLVWGDNTVTWGAGTDTDIIVAGIKALVSAINNK